MRGKCFVLRKWRAQIASENGLFCALCGRKFGHNQSISVDHIVPTSQGGLDKVDNFQPAHLLCNRIKNGGKTRQSLMQYVDKKAWELMLMNIKKEVKK